MFPHVFTAFSAWDTWGGRGSHEIEETLGLRAGEGRGGVNPSPRVLRDMYFYIFERFGQGRRSWKLWRVMAEVSQFFNIVRNGWGWGGGGGTNQRARSVGSFRVGLYSQHANCSFVVRGRVAVRCPCGTFCCNVAFLADV